MPTDSETKLALWAANSGLDLTAYFSGNDEERRALVEALARSHYKKGTTEGYINTVGKLWKDIQPILQTEAEEKVVDPKLAALERVTGEVNTRREIRSAREDYGAIPREKLSEPRIERYDRIGNTLGTIEKVMDEMEAEAALLGRAPAVTADEQRNVNALLREARARNITAAGGQTIGESNVRYRSGAAPRTFDIREYPVSYDSKTQTWSEASRFRVYDDEGKLLGTFDHRPSASEIKTKWRS